MDCVTVFGVDPGLSGAICQIIPNQVLTARMPIVGANKGSVLDLHEIKDLFTLWRFSGSVVFIEDVHAMPKQGVSSTFKFGRDLGQIEGLCAGIELPFRHVTPQAWKKLVLAGMDWKGNKAASLQFAKSAWPSVEWPKNKVAAIGIADALCIAEYGRRQMDNER